MAMLDVNGASIRYEVSGSGPTLVLSAAYGTPGSLWGPLVPALEKRFRVVTYDIRGTGSTELASESATIEDLADDVHALIEAVGGPALHLGHAFGGAIAQCHAVRHAADLRGLVLACSGGLFPSLPEGAANMATISTKRDVTFEQWSALFGQSYGGPGFGDQPAQQEFLQGMWAAQQTREQLRAQVSVLRSMGHHYWAQWTQPTLLLYGTQDKISVPLNAFDLARMPNARLHWLRGAGHWATIEQPQAIADAVTTFADALK